MQDKLQSGWLIHQTLLGHVSVLHHLARGPRYKDKVLKTIRAVVDSSSSSRPCFCVASFSAGCVVQPRYTLSVCFPVVLGRSHCQHILSCVFGLALSYFRVSWPRVDQSEWPVGPGIFEAEDRILKIGRLFDLRSRRSKIREKILRSFGSEDRRTFPLCHLRSRKIEESPPSTIFDLQPRRSKNPPPSAFDPEDRRSMNPSPSSIFGAED